MRTRTAMTVAGSAAALLLLGGVAYAAVQSVDTQPGPQVVVPSSTPTHDANDDNHRNHHGRGADDPATHDVNDDSGRDGSHSGSDDSGSGGGGSDDSGSGHGGHGGDD